MLLGVANGDHNAQTIINSGSVSYRAVLDPSNARVIGPDYDEIKDEPYTEKSSEKPLHHFEDKSVEFTKSSNEYFTLMPQEAQAEDITNVNMLCLSISLLIHNNKHASPLQCYNIMPIHV